MVNRHLKSTLPEAFYPTGIKWTCYELNVWAPILAQIHMLKPHIRSQGRWQMFREIPGRFLVPSIAWGPSQKTSIYEWGSERSPSTESASSPSWTSQLPEFVYKSSRPCYSVIAARMDQKRIDCKTELRLWCTCGAKGQNSCRPAEVRGCNKKPPTL